MKIQTMIFLMKLFMIAFVYGCVALITRQPNPMEWWLIGRILFVIWCFIAMNAKVTKKPIDK